MAIQPYIYFRGNAREAIEFYTEAFKAEEPRIMTFGDMPAQGGDPIDEEVKKMVLHAKLDVFGGSILFSDVPPGNDFTNGNNINISLTINDLDALQTAFHTLKVGGTVLMDLQETFWSKSYGSLTDKYGISWMFTYEA